MSMTLKAARINAGLTQLQAGKAIGKTADCIADYESGKTFPTVPVIKKIEETYHVQYADINFLI